MKNTEFITAKSILTKYSEQDSWFHIRYSMNLYRGCQHGCIYCDTRSRCYGIDDLSRIKVKSNAIELLSKELGKIKVKDTIGTGSMNDPYMPLEKEMLMTRRALEFINSYRFPVHIITKSDLVLRDADLLCEISKTFATVSFTITAADDAVSHMIEPGAPPSSARFEALRNLRRAGINSGVTFMPMLPFVTDTEENVRELINMAADAGALYILPAFGVTLRDRQRDYYLARLKELMPQAYEDTVTTYRGTYSFNSPRYKKISALFHEMCSVAGIPKYEPDVQMEMF